MDKTITPIPRTYNAMRHDPRNTNSKGPGPGFTPWYLPYDVVARSCLYCVMVYDLMIPYAIENQYTVAAGIAGASPAIFYAFDFVMKLFFEKVIPYICNHTWAALTRLSDFAVKTFCTMQN